MHSVLRVRLNLGPSYDLGVGHFCAARLQRETAVLLAYIHPRTPKLTEFPPCTTADVPWPTGSKTPELNRFENWGLGRVKVRG